MLGYCVGYWMYCVSMLVMCVLLLRYEFRFVLCVHFVYVVYFIVYFLAFCETV
jgi:hypothetical protein